MFYKLYDQLSNAVYRVSRYFQISRYLTTLFSDIPDHYYQIIMYKNAVSPLRNFRCISEYFLIMDTICLEQKSRSGHPYFLDKFLMPGTFIWYSHVLQD